MKPIGPNFPFECAAAGVQDFRFTWGTDGTIVFDPAVPQLERDKVLAVYEAHDPLAALCPQLQRLATDQAERNTCALDATIMALINQTRAEWRTWAANNFPTLTAPEKTRLGDLFWVVSVGARQRLRS